MAPTIEHQGGHSQTPANQRWDQVPGRSREESASSAWLATPSMNARDTTKVYIRRLDTGCGLTLYRKCYSHNTPGKRHNAPCLSQKRGTLKLIRLSVHLSVPLSVTKTLTWLISSEVLMMEHKKKMIFGMHDPCDKPFQLILWLDLDHWPNSRSKLLPGGRPQFSEFACNTWVEPLAGNCTTSSRGQFSTLLSWRHKCFTKTESSC